MLKPQPNFRIKRQNFPKSRIKHHAAEAHGLVEVGLHSFLTSALVIGHFPSEIHLPCQLATGVGGWVGPTACTDSLYKKNKSLDPVRNRALILRSLGMSSSGYPKSPLCYRKCVQCTKYKSGRTPQWFAKYQRQTRWSARSTHVRHPTASMCCNWWTIMVGYNSF